MDALGACRVIGRRLGLPVDDLRTLSDRGNRIVRFSPAPVVARVCSLTAFTRRDPFAWLDREVAVAQFVAAQGGPVLTPTADIDPGPYTVGGVHLSLWRYVEVESQIPTAQEVGICLAQLHHFLQHFPGELTVLAPVTDQILEGLVALKGHCAEQDLYDLKVLQETYLLETLNMASDFVLHGDAHPGNLLRVAGQWLWADLEETCRGPVYWDLATLHRTTRFDGSAAVQAYCHATGMPVPVASELKPFVRLRDLEAAVWTAGLAAQDARYRAIARDLMARVLEPDRVRWS